MAKKLTPCAKAAKARKAYKKAKAACKAAKAKKPAKKAAKKPVAAAPKAAWKHSAPGKGRGKLRPMRNVGGKMVPTRSFMGYRVGDHYFTNEAKAAQEAIAQAKKTRKDVYVWSVMGKHEWDTLLCKSSGHCVDMRQFR